MPRRDLHELFKRHEVNTPLNRTLKVLLSYVEMLCDTVIEMHFRQKNMCLHADDVMLAHGELDVVQHFSVLVDTSSFNLLLDECGLACVSQERLYTCRLPYQFEVGERTKKVKKSHHESHGVA